MRVRGDTYYLLILARWPSLPACACMRQGRRGADRADKGEALTPPMKSRGHPKGCAPPPGPGPPSSAGPNSFVAAGQATGVCSRCSPDGGAPARQPDAAGDNRPVSTLERPMPPLNADERTTLESWLDFHRTTLAMKCEGLDDEQAAVASAPPSPVTLTGLVQHMAEGERNWFRRVGRETPPADLRPAGRSAWSRRRLRPGPGRHPG